MIKSKIEYMMKVKHVTKDELKEKTGFNVDLLAGDDNYDQYQVDACDFQSISNYFDVDMGYFISELPYPFYVASQFKRYARLVDPRKDFYTTCIALASLSDEGLELATKFIKERFKEERGK